MRVRSQIKIGVTIQPQIYTDGRRKVLIQRKQRDGVFYNPVVTKRKSSAVRKMANSFCQWAAWNATRRGDSLL